MKKQYLHHCLSVLTLIAVLFSSCGSKKNIVYFQNADAISSAMPEQATTEFNAIIAPYDNLFITVTSQNPEAVEVFNTTQFNRATNISPSMLDVMGYLVDQNGNINFPLVGEVRVAGLTKKEAIELLKKGISTFAENPVVNIRFLNYKINVMGEVSRPGVYTITDEKISVPQALALAGDLTIYGDRRNVKLIRNVGGVQHFYHIDLTTPNIFFSPYYYLLQDDILYVEPNRTRASSSTYNQNLPLFVSLISVTLTATTLFLRYK